MTSKEELAILEYVWINTPETYLPGFDKKIGSVNNFWKLYNFGYIKHTATGQNFMLSPAGKERYCQLKDLHEQRSYDRRFTWWQMLVSVLGGWLLGWLTPSDALSALSALLNWLSERI